MVEKSLKIGPSGNAESFYAEGYKHTFEAAEYLKKCGLSAFEYSFGRGVRISEQAAAKIKRHFDASQIEISCHAPYYINLANPDEEMIKKSFGYVRDTVLACKLFGGMRTVFHTAARGKESRTSAVERTKANIGRLLELLSDLSFDFILCPETLGKLNQIGTAEEIIEFCELDERLYPCFDFGHINCYTLGGLRGYDDYKRIVDLAADRLGDERASSFHVHFSKIMYGDKGEIKHLTFEDTKYGPEFEPLAKLIADYRLTPVIICESNGTQAEDALLMKNLLKEQERS